MAGKPGTAYSSVSPNQVRRSVRPSEANHASADAAPFPEPCSFVSLPRKTPAMQCRRRVDLDDAALAGPVSGHRE